MNGSQQQLDVQGDLLAIGDSLVPTWAVFSVTTVPRPEARSRESRAQVAGGQC